MHLTRTLGLIAGTALLLGGTVACSEEESSSAGATRSFEAANGTIEIPEEPTRIVALSNAIPSLLTVDAPLVGVTAGYDVATLPKEEQQKYADLDKIDTGATATGAGGGVDLDYEAIAALKPDLIVSGYPQKAAAMIDEQRLQAIAPMVNIGPDTPYEWRQVGEDAADAAGLPEVFDDGKQAYEEKAAELSKKYADFTAGKSFSGVSVFDSAAEGTFYREYNDSFSTNIAQDIGMDFGTGPQPSVPLSLEHISDLTEVDGVVLQNDPDGSLRYPRTEEDVMGTAAWQQLPAVQNGVVIQIAYANAATYPSASLALDSLDDALEDITGKE